MACVVTGFGSNLQHMDTHHGVLTLWYVLASLLAAELEVLAVTVEVAPVMPVMEVEGQVTCRSGDSRVPSWCNKWHEFADQHAGGSRWVGGLMKAGQQSAWKPAGKGFVQ
jgi:hypothetical protein